MSGRRKRTPPRPDFLALHLRATEDEGKAALEREAHDVLREVAALMRARAADLRVAMDAFGHGALSALAVRRLEAQASALDRDVGALLEGLERRRLADAARSEETRKRREHRKYMKAWRRQKAVELAEAKAQSPVTCPRCGVRWTEHPMGRGLDCVSPYKG